MGALNRDRACARHMQVTYYQQGYIPTREVTKPLVIIKLRELQKPGSCCALNKFLWIDFNLTVWSFFLKFIYSEKVTKFCEIFTLLLCYVVPVKSKVKILQNFVAFSEYMDFKQV